MLMQALMAAGGDIAPNMTDKLVEEDHEEHDYIQQRMHKNNCEPMC